MSAEFMNGRLRSNALDRALKRIIDHRFSSKLFDRIRARVTNRMWRIRGRLEISMVGEREQ